MECSQCSAALGSDMAFCDMCGASVAGSGPVMATLGGLETLAVNPGAAPTETLAPGTSFAGRYQIEGVLGAGGMGVVYRAIDTVTDRAVALKLIRPERLRSQGEVERLVAEGVTARDIRHPNVVAVYDVGSVDGTPFLSMELVEGTSLREWLRTERQAGRDVDYATAERLVTEICAGLGAAHAAGVIHRDLKPENVILCAAPSASAAPLKLLDFGIAGDASRPSSGSGSKAGLGTPHYMAPEQVTTPDSAGPSADLYSLSVCFYEMLVGVLPQGHWQPPSSGRSDIPAHVDSLVERGLSNRPANRPQTTEDYVAALGTSSASGLVDRLREQVKLGGNGAWKRPRTWGLVAAAVVVVALISDSLEPEWDDVEPTHFAGAQDVDPGPTNPHVIEIFHGDPEPDPLAPAPEPEQPALAVEDLSGIWYDGFGGSQQVTVSKLGRVRGNGVSPDGYPLGLKGRIRDGAFTYTLTLDGRQVGKGDGVWDGTAHVTFATVDLRTGLPNLSGTYHVNHLPEGAGW